MGGCGQGYTENASQTALTEVKAKLKLEQRLGDKEKELSAVKQKLQEVSRNNKRLLEYSSLGFMGISHPWALVCSLDCIERKLVHSECVVVGKLLVRVLGVRGRVTS